MFFFICALSNGCVNNREAGDLRRHRAHYDVIVMVTCTDLVLSDHLPPALCSLSQLEDDCHIGEENQDKGQIGVEHRGQPGGNIVLEEDKRGSSSVATESGDL